MACWPPVLLVMLVAACFLRYRIVQEEAINDRGIDGYSDYRRRVRWRLIPGVW